MRNALAHVAVFADRRELLAQMEAALDRRGGPRLTGPLRVGDLSINPARRAATWRGRMLTLSPKEFDILTTLAAHLGEVVSREYLFDHLWSMEFAGEERLIDRHVMKLRQKLADGAGLIETVWGTGYRLAAPSPSFTAVERSESGPRR